MELEVDKKEFERIQQELIQATVENITLEYFEYQGKKWLNEDFVIPISVIQNKLDYYIGMYEIGKLHEDVASKYQMQAILAFIEDLQEILEKGNK